MNRLMITLKMIDFHKYALLLSLLLQVSCIDKITSKISVLNKTYAKSGVTCIELDNHPVINQHWICIETMGGMSHCYKLFKSSSEEYNSMVMPVNCFFYQVANNDSK